MGVASGSRSLRIDEAVLECQLDLSRLTQCDLHCVDLAVEKHKRVDNPRCIIEQCQPDLSAPALVGIRQGKRHERWIDAGKCHAYTACRKVTCLGNSLHRTQTANGRVALRLPQHR